MYVVATAGHVDHGKSRLVQALTGTDPDRWAEEQRRGLTIDLGFAWTTLPSGADLAFVDVPGHERFVANMLAGVGAVPAALVVVAADEGWMPQTDEHVRALHALGVSHALLVVTKTDLADPRPVRDDAGRRLRVLGDVPAVTVSTATGDGLDELRSALDRMCASLPTADVAAPVRLWVDRSFTVAGAGTVVTGTLSAGRIALGDRLTLLPGDGDVVVRGLESQHASRAEVDAVARVAVNLRGVDRSQLARGSGLVTPGAWRHTDTVDVVVNGELPKGSLMTHIGSAAVPTRARPLGHGAARLRFDRTLPLHVGDRLLLREPAGRALVGADVADLSPVPLTGRGAATRPRPSVSVPGTADDVVRRRGTVTETELVTAGFTAPPAQARRVGRWWIDAGTWDAWRARLREEVTARFQPLSAGVAASELARALGVPDDDIILALVAADAELVTAEGRVRPLDDAVELSEALQELLATLAAEPLAAPDAELSDRIGASVLAHGARRGLLLHLGGGVYVAPTAVRWSVERLAQLPQRFSVSAARQVLGSSRRVVVPLLEHLDAARFTRRAPDGTRVLVLRPG